VSLLLKLAINLSGLLYFLFMKKIISITDVPILLCRLVVLICLSANIQKYLYPDAGGVKQFAKIDFIRPSLTYISGY